MIKKLKNKFIILSMIALLILLALIVSAMNIINYKSVINEADDILFFIAENQNDFISDNVFSTNGLNPFFNGKLPQNMSPETPYESRYFSVIINTVTESVKTETSRIASVNAEKAKDYAQEVLKSDRYAGFIDDFRYLATSDGENVCITFLDCGRRINAFQNFLISSVSMALVGYMAFFIVICFFAEKITHPIAESYEKQKRFITDAGHEIKTPLTIINTNVDLLEMDEPDNECISDIRKQTKHLTELTNSLVYLAKMEENNTNLNMIEIPISDVVLETSVSFKAVAESEDKTLTCNIEPLLSMVGDEKLISQLITILLDNAVKYSPKNGNITLNMKRQNKNLIISVLNNTEIEVQSKDLPYVFERFYRSDPSRNSETGGHGIGLSIAKAIVTAHKGKIEAISHDSHSFRITITLPLQ